MEGHRHERRCFGTLLIPRTTSFGGYGMQFCFVHTVPACASRPFHFAYMFRGKNPCRVECLPRWLFVLQNLLIMFADHVGT